MKRIYVLMMSAMFLAVMFSVSGCAINPPLAYNGGYGGGGGGYIGVSTPSFAFSVGNGINAYYAPDSQGYIYGYNGLYYMWNNGEWTYANGYSGPWAPMPPAMVMPGPLEYGPPPPPPGVPQGPGPQGPGPQGPGPQGPGPQGP
ncbi:MAG: hypothetical protein ACYCT7_08945 [bacterium]